MVAELIPGMVSWGLSIDDETAHREYTVLHYIISGVFDGPNAVRLCPDLPEVGDIWHFGDPDDIEFDEDLYAFCHPGMQVRIHSERQGDPNVFWEVEQKFSTRPIPRCMSFDVEDLSLEPAKITGAFTRKSDNPMLTEYNVPDEFGIPQGRLPIANSAHEPITGKVGEFDKTAASIKVEIWDRTLDLDLWAEQMNTVNGDVLWGYDPRVIKLAAVSWEQMVTGVCDYIYRVSLDFELDFDTWDRWIIDFGTKTLGKYEPDNSGNLIYIGYDPNAQDPSLPTGSTYLDNPNRFVTRKDLLGETGRFVLDGEGRPYNGDLFIDRTGTPMTNPQYGKPWDPFADPPHPGPFHRLIQYYDESDFLKLGVPTDLEAFM